MTGLLSTARAAEIHEAARAGDLSRVRAALAADPEAVRLGDDHEGRPLHFAADGGALEVIRFLLDHGARLDDVDADGDTPLHWAAIRGHIDALDLLLDRGAAINAQNHHQGTPLLYAVKQLQYDAVNLLVRRGADLELANDYGRGPLLWATREGGDIRMVRLLLDLGANVNVTDRFGATPLDLAAWRGFRVLVNLFLDRGAEIDPEAPRSGMLLVFAMQRGMERLYTRMVELGKEVRVENSDLGSDLHAAAQGGSEAIVRDLIARGAEVNAEDVFGFTPLHYAAVRGRAGVVRELLAQGANADARTRSGFSAFNLAEKEDRAEVLAVLREQGVEPAPRQFPELRGAYLGQTLPGDTLHLFAPDIVTRPWSGHSSITFSPDGQEAFWSAHEVTPDSGYGYGTIWGSRVERGRWTPPERPPFARERGDDVPFFSPGGTKLYFVSNRPLTPDGEGGKENVWVVDREGDSWGDPRPLPPIINEMSLHWQVSVAANGNLYFNSRRGTEETAGLYVARFVDGAYQEPEFLGIDGLCPFIAPDESYLLFTGPPQAGLHLFAAFRTAAGDWGESIDLAEGVNPQLQGVCPLVSPDGAYLFFLWRGPEDHIAWIGTGFLAGLRQQSGGR